MGVLGETMKLVRLSKKFYDDYSSCKEILKKSNRPYLMMIISINSVDYAIPFRSNISHKYAYWTDKPNHCGLDFTKAVVILKSEYIGTYKVQLRQNEFNAIKGKEYEIAKKFSSFIKLYKKSALRLDVERNKSLIEKSALQYFLDNI